MRLNSSETLVALMRQRGLSNRTLGRWAGCSHAMVHALRSGRRTTCTPELAARLAEALQVPLEVLFTPSMSRNAGHSAPQRRTVA